MFHITSGASTRQAATLGQVVAVLNDWRQPLENKADIDITGPAGKVAVYRTQRQYLGVVLPGDASKPQQVLLELLNEAAHDSLRPDGRQPKPWEMTALQWNGLRALYSIATGMYPGLDAEARNVRVDFVDAIGRPATGPLEYWYMSEFRRTYGYDVAGPAFFAGQTNDRHEVHVAYALLRNDHVPEAALSDFKGHDSWGKTLLRFPGLRGRLSHAQLSTLCSVLKAEKVEIQPDDVEDLVSLVKFGPAEPTYVQMDDLLYGFGRVKQRDLPKDPPADLSGASEFALDVRKEVLEYRHREARKRDQAERARGNLTLRELEHREACRQMEWSTHAPTYGQMVEKHIVDRNVDALLSILDQPDDGNPATKRAIEKHFGVKLLGVKAKDRKQAIYSLAGFDAVGKMTHQHLVRNRTLERSAARALQHLIEDVEAVRYRLEGGTVMTGKAYVEWVIHELGAREIRRYAQGAASRLFLLTPDGHLQPIKAADKTLDYAKHLLEQVEQKKGTGLPMAA